MEANVEDLVDEHIDAHVGSPHVDEGLVSPSPSFDVVYDDDVEMVHVEDPSSRNGYNEMYIFLIWMWIIGILLVTRFVILLIGEVWMVRALMSRLTWGFLMIIFSLVYSLKMML